MEKDRAKKARQRVSALALLSIFWTIGASPSQAGEGWGCLSKPALIPKHGPFLLNDPRSGLVLYVESDGRHMAAISRDGKLVWHRDVFSDPRLPRYFPPPPPLFGEPMISDKTWLERMHSYVGQLSIDRLGIVPDCLVHSIDHNRNPRYRGHYIVAGSGTRLTYLIDAKTGDLVLDAIN
jgi:hypothetical protein